MERELKQGEIDNGQIHLYLSKCLFHIQTTSNYTSYEIILQAR
jgi:hypothetical protein